METVESRESCFLLSEGRFGSKLPAFSEKRLQVVVLDVWDKIRVHKVIDVNI